MQSSSQRVELARPISHAPGCPSDLCPKVTIGSEAAALVRPSDHEPFSRATEGPAPISRRSVTCIGAAPDDPSSRMTGEVTAPRRQQGAKSQADAR